MTDRLQQLEQQAAAIMSEIAALKAGKTTPPVAAPREAEGTRIVMLNDERDGLPNLDQMRKLFNIVRHSVPQVKGSDPDAALRGFCGAYRFVANCGRTQAPNAKVYIGWWCDVMKDWLQQRGAMTLDVSGASFLAAALASGDICYVPFNSVLGHTWQVGLVPPTHSGGLPATDAWRGVLKTGQILPPSAPTQRFAPPSPARVYVGG